MNIEFCGVNCVSYICVINVNNRLRTNDSVIKYKKFPFF